MIYTKIVSEKRKLTKNDNFKTNSIQRERPVINSTSAHDIINLNFGSNSSLTNTGTSEKGRSNNNLYQSASLNAINRNDDNTSIGPLVKTSSNPYNNEDFSSTSRLNPQNENITQSSTKIDINNSLSSIVLVEPIVCIIMPIYNELLPILLEAIDRIVDSNYDKSKLHLYLSFDDSTESVLYLKLMNSLGALKFRTSAFEEYQKKESISIENNPTEGSNLPNNNNVECYPPIFNMVYKGVKCTVIRNKHEGKRMTQANTFNEIKHTYENFVLTSPNSTTLTILFIDSDVLIDKNAIREFVNCFKDGKMAVTGLITCATSSNNMNFWWLLQDLEYVQGQMMDRCLESFLGGVTCLPGALTMVEFNTLK